MRRLVIGLTAAATISVIGPLRAQIAPPTVPQPRPAAADPARRYPFPGATPEDAYRDGLINRWQLEHYEGPTPPALQGPSPDGNKVNEGGGGGGM